MANILETQGVIQVVLQEYANHKLPRLILIKDRVQGGEHIYDEELTYLKELYKEINRYGYLIDKSAEFMELYINLASLCRSIMDSAIENERRQYFDV
ncbi:MAG: hypothetical protein OQL16_11145 [Gammaproteobacteria bacterium]|nr:hypothetical protein [Gammaproteobacteria bacterium]